MIKQTVLCVPSTLGIHPRSNKENITKCLNVPSCHKNILSDGPFLNLVNTSDCKIRFYSSMRKGLCLIFLCISAGLRKVVPYYFTYNTYTKRRWVDMEILKVFLKEFRNDTPEAYVSYLSENQIQIGIHRRDILFRGCFGEKFK